MTIPPYPSQPGDSAPAPQYPVPNEMTGAFWCYLGAALILLVGGVLEFGQRQALVDALRASSTGFTDDQLQQLATTSLTISFVIVVIIAALFVFFAFKLRQGRNWARIVLTVLAALALLSLLVLGGNNSPLSFVGDLASVVGCVLSYMPKSNAYINAVRRGQLGL